MQSSGPGGPLLRPFDGRRERNVELMALQFRESEVADRIMVTCGECGRRHRLTGMYRCAECGVLFCRVCIREHFSNSATVWTKVKWMGIGMGSFATGLFLGWLFCVLFDK